MGHIARPRFFRRTEEYVALMPISLAGRVTRSKGVEKQAPARHLKIGDKFKASELRLHVVRHLFLRGRIRPAGHPWTERQLQRKEVLAEAARKARQGRQEYEAELKAQSDERKARKAKLREEQEKTLQKEREAAEKAAVEQEKQEADKSVEPVAEKVAKEEPQSKPAPNSRRRRTAKPEG